jgi:hypothetical protein
VKIDILFKTGAKQKTKRLAGFITRNKDFMFRCTCDEAFWSKNELEGHFEKIQAGQIPKHPQSKFHSTNRLR